MATKIWFQAPGDYACFQVHAAQEARNGDFFNSKITPDSTTNV